MILAALMLSGCDHAPPEQALRDAITTMQKAMIARDSDALLKGVAEDFSGNDGMDHQALRRFVAIMMLQNKKINVEIGPVTVQVISDRANANFTAVASGGVSWMPEHGQIYQVTTGWRMDRGDWKLISAKWQPKL